MGQSIIPRGDAYGQQEVQDISCASVSPYEMEGVHGEYDDSAILAKDVCTSCAPCWMRHQWGTLVASHLLGHC